MNSEDIVTLAALALAALVAVIIPAGLMLRWAIKRAVEEEDSGEW